MTTTLQLFLLLSIVIFAAKTGGLVSTRLGQPAVLGELLVGVVLGPTVIDLLHRSAVADAGHFVLELGELGVVFLMFIAGLEVDLDEMLKAGRVAVFAGSAGVLLPLLLGTLTAAVFQFPLLTSIFVGLILTATSVSISAQTLLEMGFLSSKEGLALLGAAVIDDVLGILLLSLFLAFTQEPGGADPLALAAVIGRMVVFFVLAVAVGFLFVPRAVRWVDGLPVSEGIIAFVVVVMLLYAWMAEAFGQVAAITGAFIAGTVFARTTLRRPIAEGMHTLTYAFFVPIFLISIGLRSNARSLGVDSLFFATAIISIAVAAKVAGCWLGARAAGFTTEEALRVGIGMISRGEVGLIIAAIGLTQARIDQNLYAIMVVMVIVTTVLTPLLLRRVFPAPEKSDGLVVSEET